MTPDPRIGHTAFDSMARVFFFGFGLLYLFVGLRLGANGVLMIWLGLSLTVIGVAYAVGSPRLFGKRRNGTFHLLGLLIHAPFLAAVWLAWQLRRRRGEPVWNEVAPGIFVGRRATAQEMPPGAPMVVDLTCEFLASAAVRRGNYRCLPTLDGCAPEPVAFWELVAELARVSGPIFIHCAAGHGRSATLAAAVMIERGLVANAADAEAKMKRNRPRVGLGRDQRLLLASPRRV